MMGWRGEAVSNAGQAVKPLVPLASPLSTKSPMLMRKAASRCCIAAACATAPSGVAVRTWESEKMRATNGRRYPSAGDAKACLSGDDPVFAGRSGRRSFDRCGGKCAANQSCEQEAAGKTAHISLPVTRHATTAPQRRPECHMTVPGGAAVSDDLRWQRVSGRVSDGRAGGLAGGRSV